MKTLASRALQCTSQWQPGATSAGGSAHPWLSFASRYNFKKETQRAQPDLGSLGSAGQALIVNSGADGLEYGSAGIGTGKAIAMALVFG